MNVSEAIETRRSIQKFDANHTLSQTEVDELITAALLTPTAFNIQHWRFVNIADKALRQKLKTLSWNQSQVTDASLLLLVCMDLKAWNKQTQRYCHNTPPEVQTGILKAIEATYTDNEQLQRDEGFRSAAMAAMTLMLKAKEMGYDSCAMGGFDFDKTAQLINLPEDHAICMMLAIGKPTSPAFPRAGQLDLGDVLFTNSF